MLGPYSTPRMKPNMEYLRTQARMIENRTSETAKDPGGASLSPSQLSDQSGSLSGDARFAALDKRLVMLENSYTKLAQRLSDFNCDEHGAPDPYEELSRSIARHETKFQDIDAQLGEITRQTQQYKEMVSKGLPPDAGARAVPNDVGNVMVTEDHPVEAYTGHGSYTGGSHVHVCADDDHQVEDTRNGVMPEATTKPKLDKGESDAFSLNSKMAKSRKLMTKDFDEITLGTAVGNEYNRELISEAVLCDWYTPERSVYDSSMLIGSGLMYWEDSLIIVFTLFFNIVVQGFFLVVCGSAAFEESSLPAVESAQRWRLEVAHDIRNLNLIRETSLASRVCHNDQALELSTAQANALSAINHYLEPVPGSRLEYGMIMSILAAFLWVACIMQELRQTSASIMAFLSVPHRHGGALTFDQKLLDSEEPVFHIVAMSSMRVYLLVLLGILRTSIAISLCMAGLIWLANTETITDLVLNSIALVFVLDTDELFFRLTLTLEAQWLVDHLVPLPNRILKRKRYHRSCDVVLTNVLMCLPLIWSVYRCIHLRNTMYELQSAFCGGPKDFVIARQAGTQMFTYTQTKPQSAQKLTDNPIQRFGSRVVEGIINQFDDYGGYHSNTNVTYLKSNFGPSQLQQLAMAPMDFNSDWWGFFRLCKDMEDFHVLEQPQFSGVTYRERRQRVQTLKMWTGMWDASNCNSFAIFPEHETPLCDNEMMPLLRIICPHVCGCDDPLSGLLYGTTFSGCPQTACRTQGLTNYTAKLADIECKDPSPQELASMPSGSWKRYWFSAFDFISRRNTWDLPSGVPAPGGGVLYKSNLTEFVMFLGCDVLNMEGYWSWCLHTIETTTLRAFCPIACGCARNGVNYGGDECPLKCLEADHSIDISSPQRWKLKYYNDTSPQT